MSDATFHGMPFLTFQFEIIIGANFFHLKDRSLVCGMLNYLFC